GRQPNHNFWRIHQISLRIPMYNTKLVAPADVPQKWEDLNNAKWRGKAIISRSGADYVLHHAWLLGDLTEKGANLDNAAKFWKEVVATTRPAVGSGFKGPLEQLVVGDVSIMLMAAATTGLYNIRTGAPIDFVPIKKVAGGTWGLALTSKAQHPNAAKLFLDFLTTEEGALIHSNTSPNPTYQPEAAKKSYANQFFTSRGIVWGEVPEELASDADLIRASDLWLKEIVTAR
ncbi:MAG: extracellular solute-binding protein, partial [Dehalococcoidia bacterium]|nr:extracellular solute-binding protein [Dehalococcoidia bacterium]